MSGLSILAAFAMMGGSAFAAFTSQASATGNTFSTGSDSLLISTTGDPGTFLASVANPFHAAGITPGFTQDYTFFLQNNGTDTLHVSSTFSGGASNTTLEGVLTTDFSCNNGANPAAFSVTSMRSGSVDLGTITPGQVVTCTVTASLPSSADNTVAGLTTSFDALFNATQ